MRNKIALTISLVGLIVLIATCVLTSSKGRLSGTTLESREAILQSQPGQYPWKILDEQVVDGYLVCSMREDPEIGIQDNEIGIAIFEILEDGKHSFVTWAKRESDEIVFSHVRFHENDYVLIFADADALHPICLEKKKIKKEEETLRCSSSFFIRTYFRLYRNKQQLL